MLRKMLSRRRRTWPQRREKWLRKWRDLRHRKQSNRKNWTLWWISWRTSINLRHTEVFCFKEAMSSISEASISMSLFSTLKNTSLSLSLLSSRMDRSHNWRLCRTLFALAKWWSCTEPSFKLERIQGSSRLEMKRPRNISFQKSQQHQWLRQVFTWLWRKKEIKRQQASI